eukprot:gb/GECH01014093.1/.p1 GENE.gb/GECH01014093.1/~~gb/GECH01014093.1/.p1  ORF type:complete len:266 (+),score=50.59 gb/GECH01014093.1/:1-798(+)
METCEQKNINYNKKNNYNFHFLMNSLKQTSNLNWSTNVKDPFYNRPHKYNGHCTDRPSLRKKIIPPSRDTERKNPKALRERLKEEKDVSQRLSPYPLSAREAQKDLRAEKRSTRSSKSNHSQPLSRKSSFKLPESPFKQSMKNKPNSRNQTPIFYLPEEYIFSDVSDEVENSCSSSSNTDVNTNNESIANGSSDSTRSFSVPPIDLNQIKSNHNHDNNITKNINKNKKQSKRRKNNSNTNQLPPLSTPRFKNFYSLASANSKDIT